MKSNEGGRELPIGDAAARFGLRPHVLRHWEDEGLLTPGRDAAGRRVFGEEDLVRIAMILRGKEAGLGLDRMRAVLGARGGGERQRVLAEGLSELRERIAVLSQAAELLECALACEHDDVVTCPHFRRVVSESAGGLRP
ncbi:MerR family transcriptional regulator [Nocardiopsis sp. RSe5-2]|uniref:MerR family transcriptional regulator n=1 Tax=Nocardiopsis endophytica TaxID=3018445 RepID=A0ABT4UE61_9ACTN|nr:MerR family transcriptional regulator [Nocardiopsis endophytica]MDA2815282.1 MerR family transcriptional regulator [Nocardiopsis endophytica]